MGALKLRMKIKQKGKKKNIKSPKGVKDAQSTC
jgi:hypothetical protein